jgi:hypothetical protein
LSIFHASIAQYKYAASYASSQMIVAVSTTPRDHLHSTLLHGCCSALCTATISISALALLHDSAHAPQTHSIARPDETLLYDAWPADDLHRRDSGRDTQRLGISLAQGQCAMLGCWLSERPWAQGAGRRVVRCGYMATVVQIGGSGMLGCAVECYQGSREAGRFEWTVRGRLKMG